MNSKAKQRAAATGIGRRQEPAPPVEPVAFAPEPPPGPGLDTPCGLHVVTVAAEDAGKRLDRVLAETFAGYPGLSRTRLQHLVTEGCVRLDGQVVRSPSSRLPASSTLAIDIPAPAPAVPLGQALDLAIVFEDAHLLVLDKPAGLVVHPAAGHEDGTLVNALIAHCGASLSGIGGVRRPGIVHRLDKDTTGLMVVAKTDPAHQGLADLFADHGRSASLERRYTAFVWGQPAVPSGVIDRALARHPHQREKMRVVGADQGRHAVTHWALEAGFGVASRIACRLETGRTHQIRVHLTDLGFPLIGDPVYGTGFKSKAGILRAGAAAAVARLGRQALHASTLGFDHPVTGQPLSFASALPPDLAALDEALRA